ncbi:MAG: gfo/Idh/MocA family oxidoreductase [Planctomycetota bacterium]|nr:MAG: gfo/Idh/MocA family oxidoreductase [Planctomycetota bacterium]GDY08268.1 hypothetical protein LBMAG52_17540 [Planctomycetia bacterium]
MTDGVASPLRVGLIGLGRPGLYLMERFAAGGSFRVVAALADPIVADVVSPFGARMVNHPRELLAAADIDVVWFAEHDAFRNAFTPADALCEKHAIVETLLTLSSSSADRAFQEATHRNRLLLVRHPRRSDPDFRQASAVAQDRTHGAIRAAKFVSWSYGLPPRGATRGHGPLPPDASDDPQITKLRFAAHALDQLVTLVSDHPIRVFATGDQNVPAFSDLLAGNSLTLQMTFKNGCQAEIDIRLDSPTQFQSGWLLTADRGGYSKDRQFTLTDEGEIFDSPVSAASDGDEDADQFEWLAQQIRSGTRDRVEEARVRTVVAVLDAAQRSLESRQAIDL